MSSGTVRRRVMGIDNAGYTVTLENCDVQLSAEINKIGFRDSAENPIGEDIILTEDSSTISAQTHTNVSFLYLYAENDTEDVYCRLHYSPTEYWLIILESQNAFTEKQVPLTQNITITGIDFSTSEEDL